MTNSELLAAVHIWQENGVLAELAKGDDVFAILAQFAAAVVEQPPTVWQSKGDPWVLLLESCIEEWRKVSGNWAPLFALPTIATSQQTTITPVVRRCPICGSSLVATERRPDGNSTCDQGHVFPTARAIGGSHGKD